MINVDRRKSNVPATAWELRQKQYQDLRAEEAEVQRELLKDMRVVDGKLDFSHYDALMYQLREVRIKIWNVI